MGKERRVALQRIIDQVLIRLRHLNGAGMEVNVYGLEFAFVPRISGLQLQSNTFIRADLEHQQIRNIILFYG
ncbi:hypothetical protein D3C80_1953150 [compost metagenome]